MGDSDPTTGDAGVRPEITSNRIRSASLVLAIAAGTLSFGVVEACLVVAFAHPATDTHGDAGFAALGLGVLSPAIAVINVCLCLPSVWIADKFAEITTSSERRRVGLRRPGLLFFSFTFIACVDTFSVVPQRSSAFAGHSFVANMMAVPLAVRDNPWPYIAAMISAGTVYNCLARWMVRAASA